MASVLRNTRASALTLISTIGLCLAGCAAPAAAPASDPTQAQSAKAPAKPAAAPAGAEAGAAPSEAGEESPKLPKREDEERDGLRKASRPPLDMLTGNNVVYVFNFAGSQVGTSAKEQCESKNENPAQARDCVAKERGKIPVESVRFVKDGAGQYWWVTLNRYKGNLLKWHRIQFLPGKADADSVTLNLTG
ncbi:MAG TPA: hypothetical protein VHM25_24825, partial [Polyangiaceae bacterium]|nr:hypothetical protein [Polyangiaceae bacterium]